jgi:hypothetical protein
MLKTDEEYIAEKGLRCIDKKCNRPASMLDDPDVLEGEVTIECFCNTCGKLWKEVYKLVGYTVDATA